MADETEKEEPQGWMSDVQRVLALILIVSFAAVTLFTTVWSAFSPDATVLADMAKTLQQAMVNMGLICLGFFFGSSTSSAKKDDAIIASAIAAGPTGPGGGGSIITPAITAAAEAAAPAAAAEAAPPAAAEAAPAAAEEAAIPAATVVVPPAVREELDRRGVPDNSEGPRR